MDTMSDFQLDRPDYLPDWYSDDMRVIGALKAKIYQIDMANYLRPDAIVLPLDVLDGLTQLMGYPVIRKYMATPGVVYNCDLP